MKTFKNKQTKTNKKGKTMNTKKIKTLVEKVKTITLIIIITGAVSFYAGIQFQANKTEEVKQQVNQAVKEIKASTELAKKQ